jgi:hypothetical protein
VPVDLLGFATISDRFPIERTIMKRSRLISVSKPSIKVPPESLSGDDVLSWDDPD